MKHIKYRYSIIPALLCSIYAGVAFTLKKGLGIYNMGTDIGHFLAVSWQWVALAAVALWVLTILLFQRQRKKKTMENTLIPTKVGTETTTQQPQKPNLQKNHNKTETTKEDNTELLEPKAAQQAGEDKTELLEPKVAQQPEEDKTELLEPKAAQPLEDDKTELLELNTEKNKEDSIICPSCNAVCSRNSAFCNKCGQKLR